MNNVPVNIRIGDGKSWGFFNGNWEDRPDGLLTVPEERLYEDGPGMQGHHYAFFKKAAFQDFRATFEFRLTPHSDVGLIYRAADARHFNVLHFPNCGQGSRAQHFWAALSKMDDSGYMRIVQLELVRRVPSNSGIWLDAEVTVSANRICARIGRNGCFEAVDTTYGGSGRIGVFQFADAGIRNLVVTGRTVHAEPWNEKLTPRRNGSCPFGPSQGVHGVVPTASGDLLCWHSTGAADTSKAKAKFFRSRSNDHGCTWSEFGRVEELVDIGFHQKAGFYPTNVGALHACPDGGLLRAYKGNGKTEWCIAQSKDDGHSWSELASWVRDKPLSGWMMGYPFLHLQDGSMVTFATGNQDLVKTDLSFWSWGSSHCQAFSHRSTDGGRTWSDPVNLDGMNAGGAVASPHEGNLDMCEVCAAQMSDGHILALIRPIYSPWMWETWSRDGGITWEPCVRGPFPGYSTSNMVRTAYGAILVGHRLPQLTVHASFDEGRTWDQGTIIDSGVGASGMMLEVQPDLVLYVYYASFTGAIRAQLIRVTPSGLKPEDPPIAQIGSS